MLLALDMLTVRRIVAAVDRTDVVSELHFHTVTWQSALEDI